MPLYDATLVIHEGMLIFLEIRRFQSRRFLIAERVTPSTWLL